MLAPLPMLVRHADRPSTVGGMVGRTDVQGATADGGGGERKRSVMTAGWRERVRFKGNFFLALRGNEDEEEDTGRSQYLLKGMLYLRYLLNNVLPYASLV